MSSTVLHDSKGLLKTVPFLTTYNVAIADSGSIIRIGRWERFTMGS